MTSFFIAYDFSDGQQLAVKLHILRLIFVCKAKCGVIC
jgi:hypothetical protein